MNRYDPGFLTPTLVNSTLLTSGVLDVTAVDRASISTNITIGAAGTFAASSLLANTLIITAHGYTTGMVGQMTTAGSLPTGLATSTNYFVIVIDLNTVAFASSLANALAGTPIALSGGSGNSTFTPTSISGATVKPQWTLDGVLWNDLAPPTTISASMLFGVNYAKPEFRFLQFLFTCSAGSFGISSTTLRIRKNS